MQTVKRFLALGLAIAPLMTGCDRTSGGLATGAHHAESALAHALPDLSYPIDAHPLGMVKIHEGAFEEPVAPGSAMVDKVWLGEQRAFGDLNGDGVLDAAVVLVHTGGGSGTFFYVAGVLAEEAGPEATNALLLGDRIVVQSLTIESGVIIADLLTRPDIVPYIVSMSAAPSVETQRRFVVTAGQLEEAQ